MNGVQFWTRHNDYGIKMVISSPLPSHIAHTTSPLMMTVPRITTEFA